MLKPAADFLVDGGKVGLMWNDAEIKPPFTQQERWEEQQGYSPSSTAAVVAGLTVAAEMARASGDAAGATRYQIAADGYASKIEERMFTTNGDFGDGRYYIRITQNENPNDKAPIGAANGQIAPAPKTVSWTAASWNWSATACARPTIRTSWQPCPSMTTVAGGPLPRSLRLRSRERQDAGLAPLRRRRLWRGSFDGRQLWRRRGNEPRPARSGLALLHRVNAATMSWLASA
jgi:hypothetical protein